MAYNGYTNYATWRVKLEFFDHWQSMEDDFCHGMDCYEVGHQWKEFVEEYLDNDCSNPFTNSYALAFLNDVNWFEIVETCYQDWLTEHCANCNNRTEDEYCCKTCEQESLAGAI